MKYIDLFGGIGGFSYGIKQATKGKWKCVWYNDYDKFAVQTYNKNYGGEYGAKDITTVKTTDIPDHDIICGGFPCQTFSIAGKRKGFEDIRGTMFFEIVRIAKAKRTKYLFLENVKGLLNHNKGKTFTTILQTLEELGYETQWMVLNSKFFGVPQNRERVFIIGNLRGEPKPEILPFRENAGEVSGLLEGEEQWQMRLGHTKSEYAPLQYKSNITRTMEANGSLSVYDRKGFDSRTKGFRENKKISPTLTQKMGTGGNNVPMILRQRPRYKNGQRELKNYEYSCCPTIGTNVATGDQKNIVILRNTKTKGESSCLTSQMGMGGNNVPMVMNLQKRSADRPSLTKICPCGSNKLYQKCCGVPAGSGTLVKKDETYCLDPQCSQGVVARALRARDYKGTPSPKYHYDKAEFNLVSGTITQAFGRSGHSKEEITMWEKNQQSNGQLRRLTPIECERLQGFPDGWTEGVSDTQRYKQLGNAVTTKVIEAIVRNWGNK